MNFTVSAVFADVKQEPVTLNGHTYRTIKAQTVKEIVVTEDIPPVRYSPLPHFTACISAPVSSGFA